MPRPTARFHQSQVAELNATYSYEGDAAIAEMAPDIRSHGELSKAELVRVVNWKSPRSRRFALAADESLIREATRTALAAATEELRIGVLTLIPGVGFPTASVLLHFFHIDQYPIIDFRALWSLGLEVPATYTFSFWHDYVVSCRELASSWDVSMRELDRALWQYSKENQPEAE